MPAYAYANNINCEDAFISNRFEVYDTRNNEIDHYIYFLIDTDIAIGMLNVYVEEDSYSSSFSPLYNSDIKKGSALQLYINDNGLFVREDENDTLLSGKDCSGNESAFLNYPILQVEIGSRIPSLRISRSNASYVIPVSFVANDTTESGNGLCWAACIASRVNYEKGRSYTARSIFSAASASSAVGKPSGIPVGTTEGMKYTYRLFGISTTSTSTLTKDYLTDIIESNKPVIFNVFRTEGGKDIGHSVLMKGYYVLSPSSIVYMFMDPNVETSVSIVVNTIAQQDPEEFVYTNGQRQYDDWWSSVY